MNERIFLAVFRIFLDTGRAATVQQIAEQLCVSTSVVYKQIAREHGTTPGCNWQHKLRGYAYLPSREALRQLILNLTATKEAA